MIKNVILLKMFSLFFCLNLYAVEKQKLDESIIKYFQQGRDGLFITPYPAFAFCIPETSFVLQNDSIFSSFWEYKSRHLAYIKNESNDFYLTNLLQLKFFKDSLMAYCAVNEDAIIRRFIDTLNLVPEYKLQEQDMCLFFTSFTSESGIGAIKIETLLITQNLNMVFDYIENNEDAKKRFLRWINEEIKVWCPSVGSDNQVLNDRITKYLYERLSENNSPLAQQAVEKMKEWFEL